MKKKLIISLFIVISIFAITGCENKKDAKDSNKAKQNTKSYTCISEGETSDGGKSITKLIVYLDKDNYIVEHRIINDYTLKTKEMYESNKASTENNIKIHNESSSANQYKWEFESDDKNLHTISTRIYDMSGVRDSQGKTYDSLYDYFNEDGTYNVEGWMTYNREKLNGGYTCSEDK